MASIYLSKTVYYKDDIGSSNTVPLEGSITGLDSNKEYCLKFSSSTDGLVRLVQTRTLDYFYIKGISSLNLGSYYANIPLSEIVFSNNIANILLQLHEVSGNCETIVDYGVAFSELFVYNYYEPETSEDTKLTMFTDMSTVVETKPLLIEGYLKTADNYPVYNARIDFYDNDTLIDDALEESDEKVYAITSADGYYATIWYAHSMDIADNTIELQAKFAGSSNLQSSQSTIKNITIIPMETTDPCYNITCDNVYINDDLYSQRCVDGKCIADRLLEEGSPEISGKIGNITYVIDKQIGEDEITFSIPVTNTTNKTTFNYIELYDSNGNLIEKEPNTYQYTSAGGILTIELGSNYKLWSIEDVQGQNITFKLYSSFSAFSGYEIVDEVAVELQEYDENIEIVPNLTINLNKNEAVVGDEIEITGTLTTDEGNAISGTKVWVYATGGILSSILKNYLKDNSGNVMYSTTDNSGYYSIIWNAKQMDSDETVELIAKTEDSGNYSGVNSSPVILTLTDIEEEIEENGNCFISNPMYPLSSDTPCIVTTEQANLIKYGIIGVAGIYIFSTLAPFIKSAGNIAEGYSKKYKDKK